MALCLSGTHEAMGSMGTRAWRSSCLLIGDCAKWGYGYRPQRMIPRRMDDVR